MEVKDVEVTYHVAISLSSSLGVDFRMSMTTVSPGWSAILKTSGFRRDWMMKES